MADAPTAILVALLGLAAHADAAAEGSDLELGRPGDGAGEFRVLNDIAFDGQGRLHTLEGLWRDGNGKTHGNARVQVFDRDGKPLRQWSVRDDALGDQQEPYHFAVAADGAVAVAQPRAGLVELYSPAGERRATVAIAHARALCAWPDNERERFAVLGEGDRIEVIVGGALAAPIALDPPVREAQDIASAPDGSLWILGGPNQLLHVDARGKRLELLGTGETARAVDGSEPMHSVAVGPDGAVYAMTWGNPGHLLRYSPDGATVSSREGQFKWADPWSANSEYAPLAVDPDGRLWIGVTHEFGPGDPHHVAPAVVRTVPGFFDPKGLGVTQRPTAALGLKPAIAIDLPDGVAYDLAAAPIALVVAKAHRRIDAVHATWRVVDQQRAVIAHGELDLPLRDGEDARAPIAFTPKAYGWYAVECELSRGATRLAAVAGAFGVTHRYAGMAELGKDAPGPGPVDPTRAAFAGLPCVRLHATADPQRLAGLDAEIAQAEKAGCTWFVQLTSKPDCQPDTVRAIVQRYKGRVKVWEIMNEPNFTFGPPDYLATLKAARAVIKEVDPAAQVMGPDVCGIDLGWYEAFYAGGGKDLVDILSLHDYEGHESIDPEHWRWKLGELRALMARHGDAAKPIWQTERAIAGVRGECWMPGTQAVRVGLHADLLASLGIPVEHDAHYYLDDHGFGDCPSWLFSGVGPHPAVFAQRVRWALTGGRACEPLSFGPDGDHLLLGLRYALADGGSLLVLRTIGVPRLDAALTIDGDAPATLIDAFGNESTATPRGGTLTLPLGEMATYVRLAKGRRAAPKPLDFGRDQAARARIAWAGPSEGDPATLVDGVMQGWNAGGRAGGTDGKALWYGAMGDQPRALDLLFDAPRAIDRVVLYGGHADNGFCALLDCDVQCRVAGAWKTVAEVRSTLAPSEDLATPGSRYATWLLDDANQVAAFAPVVADGVRILVRRVTHGLAPDDRARAWGNLIPARLTLREIGIYGPPPPATVGAAFAPADGRAGAGTLTATIAARGAVAGTLRFAPPAGWTATPAQAPVKLAAGGTATVTATLTPPAEAPAGTTTIDVVLDGADEKPLDAAWTTVAIAAPIALQALPPRAPGEDATTLAVSVRAGARAAHGEARLSLRGPTTVAPVTRALPALDAGAAADVELAVPGLDPTSGHWIARWTVVVDGVATSLEQDLSVRRWMVLGAFANDFDKDFGPERDVDLAWHGVDRWGEELRWRALTSDERGFVDLAAAFTRHDDVCAYAVAWVRAAKPGPATLSLGTDDGAKVWFDDRLVSAENGAHGAAPGAVTVPVTLDAGWHRVRFKVMQGGGGWGFFCDLVGADGKPLDAAWSATPPE